MAKKACPLANLLKNGRLASRENDHARYGVGTRRCAGSANAGLVFMRLGELFRWHRSVMRLGNRGRWGSINRDQALQLFVPVLDEDDLILCVGGPELGYQEPLAVWVNIVSATSEPGNPGFLEEALASPDTKPWVGLEGRHHHGLWSPIEETVLIG